MYQYTESKMSEHRKVYFSNYLPQNQSLQNSQVDVERCLKRDITGN